MFLLSNIQTIAKKTPCIFQQCQKNWTIMKDFPINSYISIYKIFLKFSFRVWFVHFLNKYLIPKLSLKMKALMEVFLMICKLIMVYFCYCCQQFQTVLRFCWTSSHQHPWFFWILRISHSKGSLISRWWWIRVLGILQWHFLHPLPENKRESMNCCWLLKRLKHKANKLFIHATIKRWTLSK